jgi:NAD(P)-dependent dehydrogenase (short-subunit alcohol dehydrogenase family)
LLKYFIDGDAMTTAHDSGPVALFTGATAGLGEAILRAYARRNPSARIYFVGRNEAAAARIEADVRREWRDGGGDIVFIKADLSLLANAHAVVDAFLAREGGEADARLDFLCMSQGFVTLKPRMGGQYPSVAFLGV